MKNNNKNKKNKTLKTLKKTLKKVLPEKILQVMESYDEFSSNEIPDDAKGFSAHHTACKSAVIHAETLLKLAKWTEDENPENQNNFENLISEAEDEFMKEYENNEEET